MASSNPALRRGALLAALLLATSTWAQDAAQGFALERLTPAPAGSKWLVADDLQLEGGLGGAVAMTSAYARRPLSLASADGSQRLDVVAHRAFAEIQAAVTWWRLRASLSLATPLWSNGQTGEFAGQAYVGHLVSLEENPDTISDVRLGVDARLLGAVGGPARLGVAAHLFVPSGVRQDYSTDGTYRGLVQVLGAGDAGPLSWAAQVGVHLRPLDEASVPGSPRGSELTFGAAVGLHRALGDGGLLLFVGPELFGQTALRAAFARGTSGLEVLLGANLEGGTSDGLRWRVKLGAGSGLVAAFGAPEWRAVLGFELFGRLSPATGR